MKKLHLLLFSSLLFIFSCSNSILVTTNLHDLSSFEPDGKVYSLPKTTLVIKVVAIKHSFQPGPYQKYAGKFLGIEGAKGEPYENWEIYDINLSKMQEPDMDHFYSVKCIGSECNDDELFKLSESGLILSPEITSSFYQVNCKDVFSVHEFSFTDLAISPFIEEPGRKKPKHELSGSEHGMLPAWQKQISGKTIEEKAFEASKFIFKIRKRRFKLLAGQYEVFPDGKALEISVEELDKLEEEYLSLFMGKITTDTITRIFTYSPVAGEQLQRVQLVGFSETMGFNTTTENQGMPLTLAVEDLDENVMLNSLQIPLSQNENILFYRQPDKARVKLLYGSHELFVSELPVYQFGALIPIYINPNLD